MADRAARPTTVDMPPFRKFFMVPATNRLLIVYVCTSSSSSPLDQTVYVVDVVAFYNLRSSTRLSTSWSTFYRRRRSSESQCDGRAPLHLVLFCRTVDFFPSSSSPIPKQFIFCLSLPRYPASFVRQTRGQVTQTWVRGSCACADREKPPQRKTTRMHTMMSKNCYGEEDGTEEEAVWPHLL
jgi:hypothetical protein